MDIHQIEAEAKRLYQQYQRLHKAARAAEKSGDTELAEKLGREALWCLRQESKMSTLDYIVPTHIEAMDDLW